MFSVGFPTYFVDRRKKAWRNAGYACLAGFSASNLGASLSIASAVAAAFLLPSVYWLFEAHRERNGDKSPVATTNTGGADRRTVQSSAFCRTVEKLRAQLPFEDFVTELANGSNLYGRRFSVICVKIVGLSADKKVQVSDLLRRNVRAFDEIRALSDDEFVVCTPLLSDAKDANLVLNRLRNALLASDLLGAPSKLQMGCALHPLDGYSGKDLIASARNDLRARAKRPARARGGARGAALVALPDARRSR